MRIEMVVGWGFDFVQDWFGQWTCIVFHKVST